MQFKEKVNSLTNAILCVGALEDNESYRSIMDEIKKIRQEIVDKTIAEVKELRALENSLLSATRPLDLNVNSALWAVRVHPLNDLNATDLVTDLFEIYTANGTRNVNLFDRCVCGKYYNGLVYSSTNCGCIEIVDGVKNA